MCSRYQGFYYLDGRRVIRHSHAVNPACLFAEGVVEEYSSSPRFSLPVSICEIPNSRYESREPTIAQLLQEKALYSFSEWPKVREDC